MTCVQPIAPVAPRSRELAHRRRPVRDTSRRRGGDGVADSEAVEHATKWMPAVARSGPGTKIAGAPRSVARSASPSRMSGSGSPARTAMPVRTRADRRSHCRGDDALVVRERFDAAPPSSTITSHGAPAQSFSRIAPTAPNVPSMAAPVSAVEVARPDERLRADREAASPRPRTGAARRVRCRRGRVYWSGFAPEILTMRSHLAMSSSR